MAILIGPFTGDLIISLLALFFVIIAFIEKLKKYFYNKVTVFFIAFNIFLIISSLLSEFPLLSLEASLLYFRFLFFSLCIWFLLDEDIDIIRKFSIALFVTFIVAILSGYCQYFTGYNIFGITSDSQRLTLLISEKLYLGGYLARLMPFTLGILILVCAKSKNYNLYVLFFFLLVVTTDILIFISGERTAFILLAMSIVAFIILISSFRKIRILSLILTIITLIIITLSSTKISERNIDHTLRQLGVTSDNYSPRHLPIFQGSIEVFKDHILLGSGPKTYREECKKERYNVNKYTCSTHSHNSYLQILSETGLIGFLFLVIIFGYVCYSLSNYAINHFIYQKQTLSDYQICLLICFFITLWPFQPTMSFFNNWINTIYYFPLGFYLHSIYSRQN